MLNARLTSLSRRRVLQGLGVALPLPWLEVMGPVYGWSESTDADRLAPCRMAFVYAPNGKHMPSWTPEKIGTAFDLSETLQPLAGLRHKLLVLSGLTADKARPYGDGGGGHARAMAAFLTGTHPVKTDGTDIRNGVSVDQVAAARIGDRTRLASLEMGAEHGAMAGNCDSGYSCVYTSTVSWKSATQPLPKQVNPRQVFERLFGSGDKDAKRRVQRRRSILDYVKEDAIGIQQQLSKNDIRKLDEYYSAVRDIELRMDRAEQLPPIKTPDYPPPTGIPASYQDHVELMSDLLVLAFQADVTRVATYVLANEASNRPYPFLGVTDGHHDLSHHGGDSARHDKLKKINLFHVTQLARLLEKLDEVPEGDGTLLDHSMIAYGSGIHDGNAHNHEDLPILVAGGGNGTLSTGRHLRYANNTPLNNLWVSMLNRMDVSVEKLGDSNGTLSNLFDPKARAAPPPSAVDQPDREPIMCTRGKLLLEDRYEGGKFGRDWFRITGEFKVVNGALKCAELEKDRHHSTLSTGVIGPFRTPDFVLSFSFQLQGASMVGIGLENPKGHVARFTATPNGFEIFKWQGKRAKAIQKFGRSTWHTAIVEVYGDEMVALVDDLPAIRIQDPGLAVEKPRIELINSGKYAWFDNLRIWEGKAHPEWSKRRAEITTSE